ncbi:MAG: hypothetical protein GY801_33495 [bacterium]|nr:hypothetical protein [bacterium]
MNLRFNGLGISSKISIKFEENSGGEIADKKDRVSPKSSGLFEPASLA